MDAYSRSWLLLAVLFAIICLIASQRVERGISEPEDEEDSGSGEACGNDTCSGNGQCTVQTHGDKIVAVCECDIGFSGIWCNEISQRSYTTYCSPNPCRIGETCKVNAYSGAAMCEPSNIHPCVPNPCLNGGKCTAPKGNGFVCRCRAGHFGKWCQTPHTIGCTPATCGVHGNCVQSKCQCHYGWKGELCDVTPCIPNPCNHGTCTTIDGSFKCQCDLGYRGTVCGTRYNDRCNQNLCGSGEICTLSTTGAAMCRPSCEPNPCLNGGTCRIDRRGNGFVCRCRAGHFGARCDSTHAIGCTPATCGVHGNCVSSKCKCHSGWKGELCDVTPCIPNPCNRGTCTTVNGSFKCRCDPGYRGTVCGIRYNDRCNPNLCRNGEICTLSTTGVAVCRSSCEPNPCLNGGICRIDRRGGYGFVCHCYAGLSGERCETPQTIGCTPATCGVHGNCVSSKCQCHPGWKGELCDVTPCIPNPCNHGTCTTVNGSFKCRCEPGYDSPICSHRSNDRCNPNPCTNGQICTPSFAGYDCTCSTGYSGVNCYTPSHLGFCNPNPCVNGGICTPSTTGYSCTCYRGYSGGDCNIAPPLGSCNPNPCVNGGTCKPSTASYSCTCHYGYSGVNCRTAPPLGSCNTRPCHNGGSCIPVGSNRFRCVCRSHFFGLRCDVGPGGTNQCRPVNPCQNGGTCDEVERMVHCHCTDGYTGPYCTVQPDLCSPNPCENGGTCRLYEQMVHCLCTDSYTGPHCTVHPDPCSSNPCKNGGTCRRLYEQERVYTCACPLGINGIDCQGNERSQESPCNPNPCHGGCKCVPSCRHANGYYCSGTNGLLGRNCQIPSPVIVCGENAISISVDAAVVNEYDSGVGQFTMFMAMSHSMIRSHTCPAQNQGNSYSLVLPLPFNNCGTEVGTNADGKTIVSNYIWLNRLIANGVADMPVPILHFTCAYEKQYSVITSLNPSIDIPATIVSHGERTDSAVIDLCKSGKFCPSRCPEMFSLSRGATYTVGEELFLRITPTHEGTQFRILDLFFSCSSDPATTYASSPIVLLANGCFATGSGKYLPTNVQPMAAGVCASFPVPLLKSCARFFIHAKLQSCKPGVCVAAYTPCSGRPRRSDKISEEESDGIEVFGPIVVIKGKAGVSTKVMYPDEEYVNSTNTGVLIFKDEILSTIPGSSALLPLYVALGVLLVVTLSVFGLLVGHNWRYIHAHCGRKV